MRIHLVKLKIKIKSLAEEARIIKREERILKEQGRGTDINSLHHHRTYIVRTAARESHIIYGYLRGLPYSAIEQNPTKKPNWRSIETTLKRFATMEERSGFSAWVEGIDKKPTETVKNATACAVN